ncbi:DUF4097 family beta strand repeat-containing protein [Micromonospora sp. CPCC 205711]|uniref:DUF4097 family beta strand repeat-containing protein n=1 Tax=Micromonospora sp. CPCC 205547 TaxID=3122400 RepID=UPI002FF20065
MREFDTPHPISVSLDLPAGDARFVAGSRRDTVVEVAPALFLSPADQRTAKQTEVSFADGVLTVRVPRESGLFGRNGAVHVTISLPAGSHVTGRTSSGDFHAEGRLGDCTFRAGSGNVKLHDTGTLNVEASSGDVTVRNAYGDVDVTARSGNVRIGDIDGSAAVQISSGDVRLGEVAGPLRIDGANGNVSVEQAADDVTVKVRSGNIDVGEVVGGSVRIESTSGDLQVGVREGSAARVDASTRSGNVRNAFTDSGDGDRSGATVAVYARTTSGDIRVRRSGKVGARPEAR